MSVDNTSNKTTDASTNLKKLRQESRISVRELAAACELSKSYVSALENGTRALSDELAETITTTIGRLARHRESAVRHAVATAFHSPKLRALRLSHGFAAAEGDR